MPYTVRTVVSAQRGPARPAKLRRMTCELERVRLTEVAGIKQEALSGDEEQNALAVHVKQARLGCPTA